MLEKARSSRSIILGFGWPGFPNAKLPSDMFLFLRGRICYLGILGSERSLSFSSLTSFCIMRPVTLLSNCLLSFFCALVFLTCIYWSTWLSSSSDPMSCSLLSSDKSTKASVYLLLVDCVNSDQSNIRSGAFSYLMSILTSMCLSFP